MGIMSSVWLITGTSRGLGRELATAVLAAGHQLVATARNTDDLRELVSQYGERMRAIRLDVTDPAAARVAVAAAVSAFGRLDVIVNNAGYGNTASVEDMADADFRAQIETNFFGVVNVTRAALPVLRTQRGGHVIQISSIGGRRASVGLSAYQAAKFAVEGFSEALSNEVRPLGIRVTIVEPGGMRTDWAGSSMHVDDIREDYRGTIGRWVEIRQRVTDSAQSDPAKAARAILQIASVDDPPLRLLLGSDAVFLAGVAAARQSVEDAKWKPLSLSTDADGLMDFSETPTAKMLVDLRS
jgi:NAD(P)-dependent dehydrogenase (short-subunit alcohol dehydrogenase family)